MIFSQDFEDESDFPKTSFKNMMYGTKFNARIHVKYLKINLHIIFSICIVVQSFKIAVWIIPVNFLVAMRLQNVCKCPVHPLWNRPYIYIYQNISLKGFSVHLLFLSILYIFYQFLYLYSTLNYTKSLQLRISRKIRNSMSENSLSITIWILSYRL